MRPHYFQQKLSIYCTFVFSHRLYLHIPLWFCRLCLLCLLHFLPIRPFASSLAYHVYMYYTNLNLQTLCVKRQLFKYGRSLKKCDCKRQQLLFQGENCLLSFCYSFKTLSKPFKVIDNIVVQLWTLSRNIKHAEEIHIVCSLLYSRHLLQSFQAIWYNSHPSTRNSVKL